jgi:hypothetical protein
MRIFGREPAYFLSLIAALVALISAVGFDLSLEQQSVINALAAAAAGVITAMALAGEKLAAAVIGLFKALLALCLGFGLALSPEVQSTAMVVIELVVTGILVRPNVVAPVAAPGAPSTVPVVPEPSTPVRDRDL